MTTTIVKDTGMAPETLEAILVDGDLSKLTPTQRLEYYAATCKSLGLNPLTKPFAYIRLNGQIKLYALKDCTDQIRDNKGISVRITAREMMEESYVVTALATDKDGRTDESIGAVPMSGLRGESHSNALMKAETKAKRRVTLSISGLGWVDESEVDSIPDAPTNVVEIETGELVTDVPVAKPAPVIEAKAAEVEFTAIDPGDDKPFCSEHQVAFELRQNPTTGEARHVHQYEYERDGTTRKGWCVSNESSV